ncbi:glycosyltransferase family 4 protein [Opitutus terrae]|uniref:Glycosyl transferase group 1 n=1 Tax=Opitutus terrae (strain DSM 11246 / JCM 15787 / PB90-1) TaxID=452637 RepID=B1ZW28_OPITP|nr:glycosyltransferase family 4 protein [Opitutus terrae]ACB76042.1 glycosyl transferase group 1 [Opitutus terrae PB90-1]
MSVLISHPSVAPFVQQAARAFHEAGRLDRFVTTLRDNPSSRWQQLACGVARLARFDLCRQLARRAVTELPPEKVQSLPWTELLRLAVSRVDRGGRLTDRVWAWAEPAFDRAVARELTRAHDLVYGYEYSSLAALTRGRQLGICTCYDVPAPEPQFVRAILEAEARRWPVLRTPYYRHTARREEARTARRRAEWNAADVVIAASKFTRDSFAHAGLDVRKVRIVPYGSPPAVSEEAAQSGGTNDPRVQLLWAGTFSARKGAHYLLQAWREHRLGEIAQLRVFGTIRLPDELLRPLPAGVELGGSIPRAELMAHYHASDALIFPTLCDGFGMVVTEAWSRGLPVLTTPRAGAADLLCEHENGLLFPPADADAIADTLRRCSEQRDQLRAMRVRARHTAAGWQWSDYRAALRAALEPRPPQR